MHISRAIGVTLKATCAAGLSAALLTACADREIAALDGASPSGDAYRDHLAANYLDYAKFEHTDMYDGVDAAYFAKKGRQALRTDGIAPEQPATWNIADRAMMRDLQAQRARLVAALNKGAAQKMPATAARALVSYDCWVEQAEEGWQVWDIEGCRKHYRDAMAKLEDGMAKPVAAVVVEKDTAAAPAPAPETTPSEPAVRQYLVFFDWDSAALDRQARQIVETAAKTATEANVTSLVIVGHADRSGPSDYNQALSVRRAEAVTDILTGMGFSREEIRVTGRGERAPLVPTGDGVREPQNRRVRITINPERALGA